MANPREIIKRVQDNPNREDKNQPLTWSEIEHCMRLWHIQEAEKEKEQSRKYRTLDELWKQPIISHDDLEVNLNLVKEAPNYTADYKTCCIAPAPTYHESEQFCSVYRCANCKQVVMQYASDQTADVPYAVYAEPTKDTPLLPVQAMIDFKNYCMAWRHLSKSDPTIVPFDNEFQAIATYITQLRKNQKG